MAWTSEVWGLATCFILNRSEVLRQLKDLSLCKLNQTQPFTGGLLTFVRTISLLLNFCIIILKYLDCYYKKQGTAATSASGLQNESTDKNTPATKNLSQHPEAAASGWSYVSISNV